MGLEEKRKIKEYTDTILPERTKELLEITGAELKYEIMWDSFSSHGEALRFLDNGAFHRLNMALRSICTDQLARDAIKETIAVVQVHNVATKNDSKMLLENKVFEMHCAYALGTEGFFSDNEIRQFLLKKL